MVRGDSQETASQKHQPKGILEDNDQPKLDLVAEKWLLDLLDRN